MARLTRAEVERIRATLPPETFAPEPGQISQLMLPTEVADAFGVNRHTIHTWGATGRLTVIRTPGGHRRYLRPEVDRLLRAAGRLENITPDGYADGERRLVPAEVSR